MAVVSREITSPYDVVIGTTNHRPIVSIIRTEIVHEGIVIGVVIKIDAAIMVIGTGVVGQDIFT